MHSLRFEYERDGADVVVTAKAEDDHGETWGLAARCAEVPAGAGTDHPALAIARDRLATALRDSLPR